MFKKIYDKKIITLFIILQPLIDVLTYFVKNDFNFFITIGMLIRFLFLMYAIIYILFVRKEGKKKNYIYLILLFLVFLGNFILNYFTKTSYNFFEEGKNILKIIYFPILLVFFMQYNKDNSNNKIDIKVLLINSIFIAGALLLSKFTGTQSCSYGNSVLCVTGNSGWFYSINEISGILLILLSVSLYELSKEEKISFIGILALFSSVYSILDIGTKASYIGLVAIILSYVVLQLLVFLTKREKKGLKSIGVTILILLIVYLVTPGMPVCYNNYRLFMKYNIYCQIPIDATSSNKSQVDSTPGEEEINNNENINYEEIKESFENNLQNNIVETVDEEQELLLNGRDKYLDTYQSIDKNSSILTKLFGLGYKNISYEEYKVNFIIERDFHDLFFEYGYFGFALILFPLAYGVLLIFINYIKHWKTIFKNENIIIVSVIVLLGGSYIAGHVLFSPAVVTYLAFVIGYFYGKIWEEEE